MKSLLSTVLFVPLAAAGLAADTASLSGNWQVHNSIAGNESDQTCTFTQKDAELTGTCKSEIGTVNLNGKVDGKKVSWVIKTEYNGGPLTLTYNGMLDAADKFNGTVNVEEYSVEGDFTATRAK